MKKGNALPLVHTDKRPLFDRCGIVAAYSPVDVPFFQTGLRGLQLLQTRGYDGAGFWAVDTRGANYHYKETGMINEVFSPEILRLYGEVHARAWVYQVRYGTSGGTDQSNVQPFVMTHRKTGDAFVVAHNGQFSALPGTVESGQSDTYGFAKELSETNGKSWDVRIVSSLVHKTGAWSLIVGTEHALYLARDSWGFRPLVYGHVWKKEVNGYMWVVASETSSLETMGAADCFELMPGTIAKITSEGLQVLDRVASKKRALCIFENVYIQHGTGRAFLPRKNPRVIMNAPTVDDTRRRMGVILAREAPLSTNDVDMVMGVPGTGIEGGMQYARALNIPYLQAITDKSRSHSEQRTFMSASIDAIYQKVLDHFLFDAQTLKGRRVVLVDDSIVRGNITKGLIYLLKERYEVRAVHLRILCPPIDKPCHLGISTRSLQELIAARHDGDISAIQAELKAESLRYLSVAGLREAVTRDPRARGFCMGCMVGQQYPIDALGRPTTHATNGHRRVERPIVRVDGDIKKPIEPHKKSTFLYA